MCNCCNKRERIESWDMVKYSQDYLETMNLCSCYWKISFKVEEINYEWVATIRNCADWESKSINTNWLVRI